MLHLTMVDGSNVYISALAVLYVVPNGREGQCDVHVDGSTRLTIAGDAKHVAETVHKALLIIHSQE